ncbi:MAG TPA: hypothetical protein VF803_03910, partial [Candidatus Paceibacterota bacterium]
MWRNSLISLGARIKTLVRSLGSGGRALFYLFAVLIILSSASLLLILNAHLQVEIPTRGGSYSEGIIGTP